MMKSVGLVICLTFIFFTLLSQAARPIISTLPHALQSFKINGSGTTTTAKDANSCAYTISIKTSCSSPKYTRDQISLGFGDAYGNQVYVPRIDDPQSRAFERCSVDTYEVNGPCTYPICYLYLYRSGYDGWKPESVTVYAYHTKSVSFYFNTYIPNDVWFGFNQCNSVSSSSSLVSSSSSSSVSSV
ncbi:hypothetical protein ACFE04_013327 [Oxalis oulophora]